MVVDAGDLKEIQVCGHVVSARHAVGMHRVLADARVVDGAMIDRFLGVTARLLEASTLFDFSKQSDPFAVKLILNVQRRLDVLHVDQLAYRADQVALVPAELLYDLLSFQD